MYVTLLSGVCEICVIIVGYNKAFSDT